MTVDQQQNAFDAMVQWLAKTYKTPVEMEIAHIMTYAEKDFAVFKYKLDDSDEWYLALCGGYKIGDKNYDSIIWSEKDVYAKETYFNLCIDYIVKSHEKQANKNQNDLEKIRELYEHNKWQELVDFCDHIIEKYKMPREENGKKCFQHPHQFDYIYTVNMKEKNAGKPVNNDEFQILRRKLFALIELNKLEEADKLIDEILEIVPNYVPIMFERIEICKRTNNLERYKQELDRIYNDIWNGYHFGKFLRLYAWYCVEKQEYTNAVYLLSCSLYFDDSDDAFKICNNELDYITSKTNHEGIPKRPGYNEMLDYLKSVNLPSKPTQENLNFAKDLYDYCLSEGLSEEVTSSARQNLLVVYKGWDIFVKIVDVGYYTPNKLMCNFNLGYDFQIHKSFEIQENGEKQNNYVHEFKGDTGTIKIEVFDRFKTDEEYQQLLEQYKAVYLKTGHEIVKEKSFEGQNQINANNILFKDKEGNSYVTYWFKFRPDLLGCVSAVVDNEHRSLEKEIVNIVSTWEYMK